LEFDSLREDCTEQKTIEFEFADEEEPKMSTIQPENLQVSSVEKENLEKNN